MPRFETFGRIHAPASILAGVLATLIVFSATDTALAQTATPAGAAATAERQGVTRQNLQRHDLGLTGREVVQSIVHVEPGVSFPAHRHPGEEAIFVLSGTFVYELEGRGPVTVLAGESLFIPAGVAHSARNAGTGRASELATHIVEKGRPLLSLAE